MKIIKPEVHIENQDWGKILKRLEVKGRLCYKSEDRITETSSHVFIQSLIQRNHLSVLEHGSISVKFIVDRGVSHEIVRHRIGAYSQESTRYCNYGVTEIPLSNRSSLPGVILRSEPGKKLVVRVNECINGF